MVPILMALLIVIASLGGFAGTVYMAQDDLPGQALYPLKTWSEDVQIALTVNSSIKVKRLMDLAQRRVEEVVALIQIGREPPEAILQRMEQHFHQAMERAASQGDGQMIKTLALVEARLRVMQQMLSQAPQTPVRERVWARLEAWRRLAEAGEADPARIRLQIQERVREGAPATPEPRSPQGPPQSVTPGMGPHPGPTIIPSPTCTPGMGPHPGPTIAPSPTATPGMGPHPGPTMAPSPTATPSMGPHPGLTMAPSPTATVTPDMGPGSGRKHSGSH